MTGRCPHCGGDLNAPPTLALGNAEVMPRDLGFAEWWAKYPRKVGKLAAEKAYRRAIESRRATPDDLARGLVNLLLHLPEEREYIPHPSTWLNEGRWADEYADPETPAARDAMRDAVHKLASDLGAGAPRIATSAPMPRQAIAAPAQRDEAPNRWEMQERLRALASGLGKR